jgi:hypothetical protein
MPTSQWILCNSKPSSYPTQQCHPVSAPKTGLTTRVNISVVDDTQIGEYICIASYLDVVEYMWNVSVVTLNTGQSSDYGE